LNGDEAELAKHVEDRVVRALSQTISDPTLRIRERHAGLFRRSLAKANGGRDARPWSASHAHRIDDGADKLHRDPFTTIGQPLEKNAVRAAIELLPDAQQRQVMRLMYVEGLAQSEVCEVLGLSKTRISRFHSAGVETVQKLLLLGTALEQEHVAQSVAQLSERRPREVLLALYRDRLDYPSARSKLGVGATELEELHQAALDALIEHGRCWLQRFWPIAMRRSCPAALFRRSLSPLGPF